MISTIQPATGTTKRSSVLARLARPAILLLILVNVGYFAGNAVLDLWQVLGPSDAFAGTIARHDRIVVSGENATEYYVLTLVERGSELRVQVPEKAFNATVAGENVSGRLDARGLFGHNQALRALNSDGKTLYAASAVRRSISQIVVLLVVMVIGALTARWLLRPAHRAEDEDAGTASALA
jgi:hypothetical protein